MTHSKQNLQAAYEQARDRYAALGVDVRANRPAPIASRPDDLL